MSMLSTQQLGKSTHDEIVATSEPFQDSYERYTRLAELLQPSISGSVHIRSEEDTIPIRPVLSPTASFSSPSSSKGSPPVDDVRHSPSSDFARSARIFNAAAPLAAWMVVRPKNTQDVVK
jgi:hypothetical protein